MREYKACHTIGQRRLADARWSADQPGMRKASAFVRLKQGLLGVAMAKKRCRLAGQFAVPVVALVAAHGPLDSVTITGSGRNRSRTTDHIRSATTSRGARPSTTMQRSGSSTASAR